MEGKGKEFDYSKYEHWIDPNEVQPYERNAKDHPKRQVNNIANSIHRFGWQQDTCITSDNVVVIGHGRRLAAIKLGCMMPYHRIDKKADDLTEEDIRELRLIDNMLNESPWNLGMKALESMDLSFEGFDLLDVTEEIEAAEKKEQEKRVAELELKAFEHYDYIVFVFRNQFDWLNALGEFNIQRVDAGYGNTKKIGIGRVLDGAVLLRKIQHQDSDSVEESLDEAEDDTTAT